MPLTKARKLADHVSAGSVAASRLALGAISMFLGEAASAAWAELSQCREQEPGPPRIFLEAYFTSGVFGWSLTPNLLLVCQLKTNQVGQKKVCRDILSLVGLARHSGSMLNFPLLNGSTSILLTKPS